MAYNEELAKRMRSNLSGVRGLQEKKMFGGIGFLINGNMACGVHKEELILRLDERDFADALKKPHVRVFDMSGRPMKGWVMVAPAGYRSDTALKGWMSKSLGFAKSLPPK